MSKTNRESLNHLKSLVGELTDRDTKLKQDMQLFEDFFENFPIPVTMWFVSKDGNVMSHRGNGLICKKSESLNDLFLCPIVKDTCLEAHKSALQGESVQQFVTQKENIFYVSIVPRKSSNGEVVGVAGIAWDVTSNAVILSVLEEIQKICKKKDFDPKEVARLVSRGLRSSRLRMLIQEDN